MQQGYEQPGRGSNTEKRPNPKGIETSQGTL